MIIQEELSSNRFHDNVSATYGLNYQKRYAQFIKFSLVERFAKTTHRCLDIGIANGIFAIPLSRRVKTIYGVDISQAMLTECQKNLEAQNVTNVELFERSVTSLGFENQTFDLVYAFSMLTLLRDPELGLKEIHRVLKEGGIAIFDMTGKYSISYLYWSRFHRRQGHFGLSAYSLPGIKSVLTDLGFEVRECHSFGVLAQLRLIKGIHRIKFLETLLHKSAEEPDLDCRVSGRIPWAADRWYFVVQKLRDAH